MKTFGGPALFLDRSDINTDEIIPAKYLTEITKEDLKPYLLEDLKLPGFRPKKRKDPGLAGSLFPVPISAAVRPGNMPPGCLRSTESTTVIAESFARIFRQNMFNCGMAAIELSAEKIESLFRYAECPDTRIDIDVEKQTIGVTGGGNNEKFDFEISPFDKALVLAGGWVDYVDQRY